MQIWVNLAVLFLSKITNRYVFLSPCKSLLILDNPSQGQTASFFKYKFPVYGSEDEISLVPTVSHRRVLDSTPYKGARKNALLTLNTPPRWITLKRYPRLRKKAIIINEKFYLFQVERIVSTSL